MNPMLTSPSPSRKKSPLAVPILKPHGPNSPVNQHQRKRGKSKNISKRMKRLLPGMEEISKEQTNIKRGQREIREKIEAIELECEHLRQETDQIMLQSMKTQIRLVLMFQILKARQNQEFDKAAKFTDALRQLIARENQQK